MGKDERMIAHLPTLMLVVGYLIFGSNCIFLMFLQEEHLLWRYGFSLGPRFLLFSGTGLKLFYRLGIFIKDGFSRVSQ